MKAKEGPYKVNLGFANCIQIESEHDSICSIGLREHGATPTEKELATARLLAASWSLLEALKNLVECSPCQNGCDKNDMTCATRQAEAAIALTKKEGE